MELKKHTWYQFTDGCAFVVDRNSNGQYLLDWVIEGEYFQHEGKYLDIYDETPVEMDSAEVLTKFRSVIEQLQEYKGKYFAVKTKHNQLTTLLT